MLSLTPTALARDSRTLKSAMAYAGFGCESVVIEGLASDPPIAGLPVAVRSVRPERRGVLRRAGSGMLRRQGALSAALTFAAFLGYFAILYGLRPIRFLRPASLYHLHSYEYFPLVWLWSKLVGGRIVYDAHDFYSGIQNEEELSPAQRRWIRPFQLWVESRCVAAAAAFLTVNEGTAALMARQFGRRPAILRNCHDFRLDRPPARTIREAAGVTPEDFLVAAPGNCKPGHATRQAIEALRLLPSHVHLAFVGGGYEWCRALAEEAGVGARVHPVGAVPANEVVPFIASADAGLVLYREHNANYLNALPNGFFQSLAAGLALVYSRLPGMVAAAAGRDLGEPVDAESPREIADAIRRLLDDPAERRARADAARGFSTAVNFEREEKILRDIVEELATPGNWARRCAE